MVVRNIVEIDEKLCDGCGLCVPNCAEGALQIIDGKVKLIKEIYCDGLGACIGHCPRGAITVSMREAEPFDDESVKNRINNEKINKKLDKKFDNSSIKSINSSSHSSQQWPVKLKLVPTKAPYFDKTELIIVADCVPIAYPLLKTKFLNGRSVVIGCPKFDENNEYVEKLSKIFSQNEVKKILILNMEVPCCNGLRWIIDKALKASGKKIPIQRFMVKINGDIMEG